jgi:hypothetical protein
VNIRTKCSYILYTTVYCVYSVYMHSHKYTIYILIYVSILSVGILSVLYRECLSECQFTHVFKFKLSIKRDLFKNKETMPLRHMYQTRKHAFMTYTYKYNFKNSLIIHEENTKKNDKRVVSLYVDKDFPSFT